MTDLQEKPLAVVKEAARVAPPGGVDVPVVAHPKDPPARSADGAAGGGPPPRVVLDGRLTVSYDSSQWWALGTMLVLTALVAVAVLVGVSVAVYNVFPGIALLFDPSPKLTLQSVLWIELALAAFVGMAVNRLFVMGYHGFSQKDFDPESVPYHFAILVQAPFIALAVIVLGRLILPTEVEAVVLPDSLTPLLVGFTFLLGYWSNEILEPLHRKFLKLLGEEPAPRGFVRPRLDGHDLHLPGLLANRDLDALMGGKLRPAVEAFAKHGFHYAHDLVGGMDDRRMEKIAKKEGLSVSALQTLVDFADVARGAPSVDDALRAYRAGMRNGADAESHLRAATGSA